jgi:hypothetical protein
MESPSKILNLSRREDDRLWAVQASVGRAHSIAEVFRSQAAAQQDAAWRTEQVKSYADFLRRSGQPVPNYTVTSIRREELPRKWQPLPALGFLRGRFS